MDDNGLQLDGQRILAIIQQRQPLVYENAVQQATIEQQAEVIAALRDRLSPDQVSAAQ